MKAAFFESLKAHQIGCAGISGFSLPCTLLSSDNSYLKYPVNGVIRFCEQGLDLSIIVAVFYYSKPDGSLGAPVEVCNPVFAYAPDRRLVGRNTAAVEELAALAESLTPSGEIGDGMVAQFQALARRVLGPRQ